MLNQRYAELPSALGVQADGQLVEVFVSENGMSWTIVLTRPDGWSCIVAVGEHWERCRRDHRSARLKWPPRRRSGRPCRATHRRGRA